jgi:hypothetical protein
MNERGHSRNTMTSFIESPASALCRHYNDNFVYVTNSFAAMRRRRLDSV